MANYENFYNGSTSSMSSDYSEIFTGYRIAPGRISSPTSIQTADQIREVSSRLSEGVKGIELQPINPEVFEAIPRQHLREINRLTKLTGGEVSVHAPMIDPAGFTRDGGWSPSERELAERHLTSVIDRVHELNPTGNVPVTIHASATGGTEFALPAPEQREQIVKSLVDQWTVPTDHGGLGLSNEEALRRANREAEKAFIIAVHQETGQMTPVKREQKITPEHPEEFRWQAPAEIIQMINNGEWSSTVARMQQMKKMSDDLLEQGNAARQALEHDDIIGAALYKRSQGMQPQSQEEFQALQKAEYLQKTAQEKYSKASAFLQDVMAAARTAYNQAFKFSTKEEQDWLKQQTQLYQEVNRDRQQETVHVKKEGKELAMPMYVRDEKGEVLGWEPNAYAEFVRKQSKAADDLIFSGFGKVRPQTFVPIEEFATKKSSETLGNVAFNAFKKFGESTPFINIENLYSGMAFSRAEELTGLVDASRKQFIKQAVNSGMKEADAKKAAEKTIGITLDLGHLSMMRKGGYTEKDLIEETRKLAPYVKHVHLADNFGFADSHLPPGMATVPHKGMLTELEKAGYKGKAVIEAGAFVQHFKTSPHPLALEGLGSPMYSAMMQPYWNQARALYGGYFTGFGTMLPEQHFSMYGAGFSGMPTELGGQMPGKQSRFSGAPME